jgi:hypothetical protein
MISHGGKSNLTFSYAPTGLVSNHDQLGEVKIDVKCLSWNTPPCDRPLALVGRENGLRVLWDRSGPDI